MPTAIAPWSLDSGGFTELGQYGGWKTTVSEYVDAAQRYREEIGHLDWAAPMDWMCEPWVIAGGTHRGMHFAGTGLSVLEHQQRTVESVCELRSAAPEVHFIPVLQGWQHSDYITCIEIYERAGFDLSAEPLVGLGSVCRRQSTDEIEAIVRDLASEGLRLHGFGVKTLGLEQYAQHLTSADSLAWSLNARKNAPLPGCHHGTDGNGSCGNCIRWALAWRERLMGQLEHQERRQADVLSLWTQEEDPAWALG